MYIYICTYTYYMVTETTMNQCKCSRAGNLSTSFTFLFMAWAARSPSATPIKICRHIAHLAQTHPKEIVGKSIGCTGRMAGISTISEDCISDGWPQCPQGLEWTDSCCIATTFSKRPPSPLNEINTALVNPCDVAGMAMSPQSQPVFNLHMDRKFVRNDNNTVPIFENNPRLIALRGSNDVWF